VNLAVAEARPATRFRLRFELRDTFATRAKKRPSFEKPGPLRDEYLGRIDSRLFEYHGRLQVSKRRIVSSDLDIGGQHGPTIAQTIF